ncbi:hypothetical protein BD779DRAFT_1482515 [Infundibulicybe gibba]|nr:hypothetical protein BD779DRAFT_1482515 [Infundibulicybe gibba]
MPPNVAAILNENLQALDHTIMEVKQLGTPDAPKGPQSHKQARKNKRSLEEDNCSNSPSKRIVSVASLLTNTGPTDPMVQDEEVATPSHQDAAVAAASDPPLKPGNPRSAGTKQEGTYILAYLANDRVVEEAAERVLRLTDLVNAALKTTATIVGHARPANHHSKDIKPLFPYYIGGLSQKQMRCLTTKGCWSTPSLTAFFITNPLFPSEFVMTLENFPLAGTEESNKIVKKTVQQKILQMPHILNFLAVNRNNIPYDYIYMDLLNYITNSVMVTNLLIVQKGTTIIMFNVYIHPPTTFTNAHETWVSILCNLNYTCIHGSGKPQTLFHCTCCKGKDHPAGHCGYLKLPRWNNNHTLINYDQEFTQPPNRGRRGRGRRGRGSGSNCGHHRGNTRGCGR